LTTEVTVIHEESSATREGRSVPTHEQIRRLEERHAHELMDYEERCELWSRIAAARAELAKAKG